jgi:hypothetical protein
VSPALHFEKIWWSCGVIKVTWESKRDHWTLCNKDKHGHTRRQRRRRKDQTRETSPKTHEKLFLLKKQQYRSKNLSIVETYQNKKCTANLEEWIQTTTKQTIHYLLNIKLTS